MKHPSGREVSGTVFLVACIHTLYAHTAPPTRECRDFFGISNMGDLSTHSFNFGGQ
jgi:hypothetical protein